MSLYNVFMLVSTMHFVNSIVLIFLPDVSSQLYLAEGTYETMGTAEKLRVGHLMQTIGLCSFCISGFACTCATAKGGVSSGQAIALGASALAFAAHTAYSVHTGVYDSLGQAKNPAYFWIVLNVIIGLLCLSDTPPKEKSA
eukprot:m.52216 g.52216  ORF g.52216 m.52216 type:complete len:141 (-) comp15393_c1_seq6:272-694(-)